MIPDLARFHVPVDPEIVNHIAQRKHYDRRTEILPSVLEAVGETPLISLSRLAALYKLAPGTELLGKVEFFNAGGSVKDRVARAMIEHQKILQGYPEDATIIEASSGNTGIGLAIAAAATKRKCLVIMTDKIVMEKESILRSLGSEVIRTPVLPWYDPKGPVGVACQECEALGGKGIFFNQYRHPANVSAHYTETAQELITQSQGHLDYCVIALGTCGTAAGIGARFRKEMPSCKIVVVEPQGSVIQRLQDPKMREHRVVLTKGSECPTVQDDDAFIRDLSALSRPWKVEGIGKDFLPPLLSEKHVDAWMVVPDKDSFEVARNTIRSEGLLIGGSCGTALAAALELARGEAAGKRIAVILADGARNYLSTFLDDGWMLLNAFLSLEKMEIKPRDPTRDGAMLRELLHDQAEETCIDVDGQKSVGEALTALKGREEEAAKSNLFVRVMNGGHLYGVISLRSLRRKVMTDPGLLQKELKDAAVTIKVPLGVVLNPDIHTWLQGLFMIDEFERVYKEVHDGYIIVDDRVISRQTFMNVTYPVACF